MTNTFAAQVDPAAAKAAAAVASARETFRSGRTRPLAWRRAQLEGLANLIAERDQDIAEALKADLNRSEMGTFMADVAPVRAEITHTLASLPRWAEPTKVPVPLAQRPGTAWSSPEPKGVVLIIGAWNFPLLLTLHPLVSALAAGNTAVIKPSENSPNTAALLAELLPRYLDPTAVHVINGDSFVAAALVDQPLDHIFFTGSSRVGRIVAETAARTLTPVTLELGGKSPVIVAADADLRIAARRIAWAKCVNAGQACIAPDYVLVEDAVRPALVEHLLRELADAGRHEQSRIVSDEHFDRLEAMLDGHGGEVSGGKLDRRTRRIEPAIVTDPDPDSALMREEIFGPILPVLSVPDIDAAVEFVNDRPKPLSLYVFSESARVSDHVVRWTSSGSVGVNHLLYQLLVPDLPFGGIGPSGQGSYHGRHGFETFSHRKSVLSKPTTPDPGLAYPPYGAFARKVLRRLMG